MALLQQQQLRGVSQRGVRSGCRPKVVVRPCQRLRRSAVVVAASSPSANGAGAATASADQLDVPAFPSLLPLDANYEPAHTFSEFANWLVPGALLVGRYPYVEPSRCKTHADGERNLERILQAGVTSFVCLQKEVPPQAELTLAGKSGFMPYKAPAELIKHSLNGPPPADLMNGLRTPELDRFLPPRHKPASGAYASYAAREQLEFGYSPIEDLGVPDERQLDAIVADLQARVERGEVVYAHCWGGRGRVGLVGACFLAATYGITADEALERVQRAFDTRRDNERRSPETDEQHAFVKRYVASHAERERGKVHKA